MPSRSRRVREALVARLAAADDLRATLAAGDEVLREALAAETAAWGTVDPATTLSTSCARFGVLADGPTAEAEARERRLFALEWDDDEPHTFWDLARRGVPAAALRSAVGAPHGVRRFDELLAPAGIHDELRVRFALDGDDWATAILYRLEARPFTADDVALAAQCAPVVARAVRRALLQAVCDSAQLEGPPGSLLLGSDGDLVVSSAAAEEQLAALDEPQVGSVLAALAGAVRARGAATMTATGPGGVVALHGSPAKGVDGAVAVVVERPRPVQLAPLVMRAVGFTAREREVAEALLQGATRRQIARRAGASEHTVGDHLRSLYRKAGVSGRAELAALLYDRHYATPRATGTPPSPYGYFVGMG